MVSSPVATVKLVLTSWFQKRSSFFFSSPLHLLFLLLCLFIHFLRLVAAAPPISFLLFLFSSVLFILPHFFSTFAYSSLAAPLHFCPFSSPFSLPLPLSPYRLQLLLLLFVFPCPPLPLYTASYSWLLLPLQFSPPSPTFPPSLPCASFYCRSFSFFPPSSFLSLLLFYSTSLPTPSWLQLLLLPLFPIPFFFLPPPSCTCSYSSTPSSHPQALEGFSNPSGDTLRVVVI